MSRSLVVILGVGFTDASFRGIIGSYKESVVGPVAGFNYFRSNCFTDNLRGSSIVMTSL